MSEMPQKSTSLWSRIFLNRDYGLLFMGRLVSELGDGIHYFALTWLILDLTGSGAALGTLLMITTLPTIILAPFAGVVADTVDRKLIVVGTDLIRGLIVLYLAVIYYTGRLNLPILYIVTAVLSACGTIFGPAIVATIPNLVKKEELVQANARDTFSSSATSILGPVVGAALLGTTGYVGVFLINGLSFVLSGVSEMFIRFPRRQPSGSATATVQAKKANILQQFEANFKAGLAYIWKNPGLRTIVLFAFSLNFIGNPMFAIVFPYFGKQVLQMDPGHYSMTQSSFPAGILLGTFLVGAITQRIAKPRLLSLATVFQGSVVALMSIVALPAVHRQLSPLGVLSSLAVPILFLGIANVQVNVPLNVMLQETVPDDYRGRVFGLLDSLVQMFVPLAMALFGVLVDIIPTFYLVLMCGLVTVFLGFRMSMSPGIQQLFGEVQTDAVGSASQSGHTTP